MGRGLLEELGETTLRSVDARSTISKQNSVDSNGSSSSGHFSDVDTECQHLMVNSCLTKLKDYSWTGVSRMGTPTLHMEAQIQCAYRSLGLPDDGMPGPRLMERYQTRCEKSHEALSAIQSTIASFGTHLQRRPVPSPVGSLPSLNPLGRATKKTKVIAAVTTVRMPVLVPAHAPVESKITCRIDRTNASVQDIKAKRSTLEEMFKHVSGSFKPFTKAAIPQPLLPPSDAMTKVLILINNVNLEHGAIENLLDQVDGIVAPLSSTTLDRSNKLKAQIKYIHRQNLRVEAKHRLGAKYNVPLPNVPGFNAELIELNKIIEIFQKELNEYGTGLVMELQSYYDRVQEHNRINNLS